MCFLGDANIVILGVSIGGGLEEIFIGELGLLVDGQLFRGRVGALLTRGMHVHLNRGEVIL